jgi:hypothetical protein
MVNGVDDECEFVCELAIIVLDDVEGEVPVPVVTAVDVVVDVVELMFALELAFEVEGKIDAGTEQLLDAGDAGVDDEDNNCDNGFSTNSSDIVIFISLSLLLMLFKVLLSS